ncbi:MAG: acetyl-CoA carboxylase, carboxyltransferase subunit beta [Aureispira sp.]
MGWYKRDKNSITTSTSQKKETPDGIWHQCNACKATSTVKDLIENLYVCPACNQHERIGSQEYFEIIFDNEKYKELFTDIIAHDFLNFTDLKPYQERLEAARKKTELDSAMRVAKGKVNKLDLVIAAMDFGFIGGSMGSVMGEKIAKAIDYCIENKTPLMIISKSGGARMMESAFSLMQMAKISAKLTLLADAKVPYLSFLTDPTTGGVSASFAMLGDFNFSEPNALIAFAGPRIVKETLKLKELPEGFQRSEYLLDSGFLDFIVDRKNLQKRIADLLYILKK